MSGKKWIGLLACGAVLGLACVSLNPANAEEPKADDVAVGVLPIGVDGGKLNLDFERGSLQHWLAEGEAFAGQPIEGDAVNARRGEMHSRHQGRFWIGSFERAGDGPRGKLTSAPFEVTQPFASFLIGGGGHPLTRLELVRHDSGKVIFRASGRNREDMERVTVSLKDHQGERIFIRLIDDRSGGWGHINFDDFQLHATRPTFPKPDDIPAPDAFIHEGLGPKEAAAAMTVPDGFSVTLFAGESDVVQPIAMAIDDRGRLWVAEAYSYPRRVKEEDARDRILIFEDTDGDGRFDERKVFVDRLNLVSGLEVGFGGVWVGAAPHLLFIPDRDGDDKPDGPPQVLLDGWGYQDTHETLNAFIWGPDGWLYGCHGIFTHSKVGKPGTPDEGRTALNAAIWRYHPTEHKFEVFAHGTSNPWGVDFNDYGDVFCTACVIPHLFHIIPGARYHRQAGSHFNAHTYDDIKTIADHVHWIGATPHSGNDRSNQAGGGHAHAGAMIYLGGAWPDEYRNQIFMNNIHGARINVDRLEPAGSGYVGRHHPDFLLANDRWSQIINLRYGPDGQVYMIDWYDKNQCHGIEENVHDRTNGRIFKVTYDDGEPREPVRVDLKKKSDRKLVDLQLQRNDWYVRHARRILQERAAAGRLDVGAREALVQIATNHTDASRRLRGLWALHVTGGVGRELIALTLLDENAYVRGWAIQLALDEGTASAIAEQMVRMAGEDPSPIVRRYLASAATRLPLEDRWALLDALVSHPEDAQDHNLPLLYWYAAEPLAEKDMSRALALAVEAKSPILLSHMVRRIGAIADAAAIAHLVERLGEVESADNQQLFLDGIRQALRGRRQVPMPTAWPAVAGRLQESASGKVRQQAEALGVTFGDPAALARMRAIVADPGAENASRANALEALRAAKDPGLAPTLHTLLSEPALRSAALRALGLYDHAATPEKILSVYASLRHAEKRDALATLASRAEYAAALLTAIDEKRVARTDLSADLVRQMRNLNDSNVDRRVEEVWGTVRETAQDKARLIAKYKKMLDDGKTRNADLSLGRAVFAKTCQQCHKLYGLGREVGPELTGSNRADLDYLLSNVLDPSAMRAKDYVATTIATADGRILTGIASEENERAVTLLTANETVVIPRDEIDVMEPSEKSMMPDDLLAPLSDADIRALVAYLASPAQVAMLATADNVIGFFNGQDLTGWTGDESLWSVEDGEIVGRTDGLNHNEFLTSELAVGDFRLSLKVKLVPNQGNSGIQFRSQPLTDGEVKGYQADVGLGWWGKLYEERGRGLLWNRSGEAYVKRGEWNTYEIVAVKHRIRTWINGNLCVDMEDPPGARRGIIALQLHSGPAMEVRFKDLELGLNPTLELAGKGSAGR